MKKSIFILLVIFSIFISSCAPQVTITAEVTVTSLPPTETLIPTPTLHPQFIALQEQIAASGERFSLLNDGTVQDGATAVPGIQVAADGKITITVNGEAVEIEPSAMKFDDEKGLSIKGYQDSKKNGAWTIDIPPIETVAAAQSTLAILEAMNVPVGADKVVEVKMDAESAVCLDVATGDVVCKDGKFKTTFVEDMVKLYGDAKATPYGPKKGNVPPGTATGDVTTYITGPLLRRAVEENKINNLGFDLEIGTKGGFHEVMISETDKSWGIIRLTDKKDPNAPKYFIYEKADGKLVIIPLSN